VRLQHRLARCPVGLCLVDLPADAIQPFVVIFSAIGAVVTFAISEHDKAVDRVAELSQPFYQNQPDVYADPKGPDGLSAQEGNVTEAQCAFM
jgi:hypothetical protein